MPLDLGKLREELIRDEGLRLKAYRDSLGYWTIGYGHLIQDESLREVSVEHAERILQEDITKILFALDHEIPWWRGLDDVRMRVLANMTYNLGVTGFLKFQHTLDHVRRGNYEEAANHMLKSLWAQQVPNRAKRLAEMMRTGKASSQPASSSGS